MTMVDTQRRTFNDNPEDKQARYASAKTFLQELLVEIVEVCTKEEYDGKVKGSVIDLAPLVACAELSFVPDPQEGETPEILPTYRMFVSKRYFSNNMVRLMDTQTREMFVMQADPRIILHWLTY
jgi:hypothetical protein